MEPVGVTDILYCSSIHCFGTEAPLFLLVSISVKKTG